MFTVISEQTNKSVMWINCAVRLMAPYAYSITDKHPHQLRGTAAVYKRFLFDSFVGIIWKVGVELSMGLFYRVMGNNFSETSSAKWIVGLLQQMSCNGQLWMIMLSRTLSDVLLVPVYDYKTVSALIMLKELKSLCSLFFWYLSRSPDSFLQ